MSLSKKPKVCTPKSHHDIQLSEHFGYRKLCRFALPSVIMMICTSIYSVVDGFFVSNFAGKTPFAAVNFIMPFLMILGSIGFMFGTGGGALIAKTMGEGKPEKANHIFSMIVYVALLGGVLVTVLGLLLIRPIAILMGAQGQLLENSVLYGRVVLIALPFFILQYEFQCLFATAEKPKLGLYITIMAGITNVLLDALFVAVFHWGLVGAAAATAFSQAVGGVFPLIYFGRKNSSRLQLGTWYFNAKELMKACANGLSELLSNISMSVVGMLYNIQLMTYAGENGVAAYGVLMYVSMIFQAIFIGYTLSTAPIISYHYGAHHDNELQNLRKKSLTLISVIAVVMFAAGLGLSKPLSLLFVGYDRTLLDMTVHAFTVFSFSFLLSGFSIFGSSFFTALNDGLTSALISFLRTLVCQCAAVILCPLLWGVDGIWLSIVVAEVMAVIITVLFLVGKRKQYRY